MRRQADAQATTPQNLDACLRLRLKARGCLQRSEASSATHAKHPLPGGNSAACNSIGRFYELGIGTGVDKEAASRWYHRSAGKLNTDGQVRPAKLSNYERVVISN
eukprot:1180711-Prorocentrum_minimum.AAC.6